MAAFAAGFVIGAALGSVALLAWFACLVRKGRL